MNPSNAVAIVTGGASGLGAATSALLRERGARVHVFDLKPADGRTPVDIASAESVSQAIAQVMERDGRLDIAVHCAGIGYAGRMLGREGPMPLETFEKVVRVNLIGTFNVSRLVAEAMAKNPPGEDGERGVIINTSSVAAYDGQIGQVPYAATKAAVAGMVLPMARELAKLGIRVAAIAPGLFRTPLLAALPEEAMQKLASDIPFPSRLGMPEEYARLALHIVENRYLNGEVIRLDGSLRMPPK
jgi:NAD(P)-dependent dehydrogenase (short-subunit alcohol dehydrogenase family)